MKILILGASGRTGKWVLQKALAKGYAVNILVRDKHPVRILKYLKEHLPIRTA